FPAPVHQLFAQAGRRSLVESLERLHKQLLERRLETVDYGAPRDLTRKARARLNCQLLQQSLHHSAERLLQSCGGMILEKNVYGLALIVRGHLEGTAVLGHFCARMESLAAGNITFDDFDLDIATAVLGARHEDFEQAPNPVNVL